MKFGRSSAAVAVAHEQQTDNQQAARAAKSDERRCVLTSDEGEVVGMVFPFFGDRIAGFAQWQAASVSAASRRRVAHAPARGKCGGPRR